jgi:RNA polymerase sigma-70 factor (ECF subfamily)
VTQFAGTVIARSDATRRSSGAGFALHPLDRFASLATTFGRVLTAGHDMTNVAPGLLAQRRFRDIVPPLLDDAYTLAKMICRNGADAEDIVQEAAIRALKALETTAVDRPRPWFFSIVRNAAISWMAKNRPKGLSYAGDAADLDAIDPHLGEAMPDPEAILIALEDGERLRLAITGLPSPLLETLVMRDVNGLSYRDIAEATGAPMGTVMSRLARARASLMKTLKAEP